MSPPWASTSPGSDAVSLRLAADGKVIAHSGDTEWTDVQTPSGGSRTGVALLHELDRIAVGVGDPGRAEAPGEEVMWRAE